QHLLIFDGNRRRLWRLINLERNDCRTNENSCNRNWIRSNGCEVEGKRESAGPIDTNTPERLPQKFIALPAMKFVQEIVEVTGRRLFVAFQPKQLRYLVVVEFVHWR